MVAVEKVTIIEFEVYWVWKGACSKLFKKNGIFFAFLVNTNLNYR